MKAQIKGRGQRKKTKKGIKKVRKRKVKGIGKERKGERKGK